MKMSRLLTVISAALLLCSTGVSAEFEPFQPLPAKPPIPSDNPQTSAKVELGKQLFFDNRLSATYRISCNGCHNVMSAGDDGKAVSRGALGIAGTRSAPTLYNVAYQTVYFWDGRAASLEEAIKEHLLSPTEMGMKDKNAVVERIWQTGSYKQIFAEAFGPGVALSYDTIAQALASYIRTLRTPDSDFDRYLRGDKNAISAQAKRGYHEFIEVGCASCHFWVNLSGPVPGLAFQMGDGFYELFPNYPGTKDETRYQLADDIGRYYVTKDETDRRMWRVPVLRNVALTAPYFHNGQVKTLEEAIRVMGTTQLGKDLTRAQQADIAAFLHTVSGRFPTQKFPKLPVATFE